MPAQSNRPTVLDERSAPDVRGAQTSNRSHLLRSLLWPAGEVAASVGTALLFLAWSRSIEVDPLSRRGQVSGLAALQFRFAVVSIVLVVGLVLAHRFVAPDRRRRIIALGCAVVAGLTTGLVAGGITVALHGAQFGLWAGSGDYNWILDWVNKLQHDQPIPASLPTGDLLVSSALRHFSPTSRRCTRSRRSS